MQAFKIININSAIITLKSLSQNRLGLMSQDGSVRVLETTNYKTVEGFKTGVKQTRTWGNHLSLSSSGKYAAVIVPNSNKSTIYSVEKRKLLYSTSRHQGDVESICIDDENHYFVSGGTDGKTYVWNLQTAKMFYSFPPRSDYITALDVDKQHVVSACYDKSISVLNLSNMKTPILLKSHSSVIVQLKLLDKFQLVSAEKDGYVALWDLKKSKLVHKFKKINDEITCFSVSSDNKFLFVATKLGYVNLYDIKKLKLIKSKYVKLHEKITSIALIKDNLELILGTKSGKINFFSLMLDAKKLEEVKEVNSYQKIYKEFEDNPILTYSSLYKEQEEIWNTTLEKARVLLEVDHTDKAIDLLEPYMQVKHKSSIIQKLLKDYEEFTKFKTYVKQRRYSLAYPLAIRYEAFQKSKYFKRMEDEWKLSFNKSKLIIMQKDGEQKVKAILSDFKGISSKSQLIQQLFQERTALSLFKKKLIQKDYKALFSLADKCPFIKELDEYEKLIEYGDSLYIKSQQYLSQKKYDLAIKYANELKNFKDFEEEALEMIEETSVVSEFMKAFSNENIPLMYELISKYPYLIHEKEAKALENNWNEHLILAQKYASKADIVHVVAVLEDFFEIESKYLSISLLMQEAYIAQMSRALRAGASDIVLEKAIKKYVLFFGINDHIEVFNELFFKKSNSKVELENLKQGQSERFKPSMIIMDIL